MNGGSLLLFRVLGVDPPRFALSDDELERAMKNLQKTLHPDKFSTAPKAAREHSADQASLVNRAYATLRDPLRRAKYIFGRLARAWRRSRGWATNRAPRGTL